MGRNEKIKTLERQLKQMTEAMVVHEQIARDAMSAVVNQANEIVGALTHDLGLALALLEQHKPPAQHALALLQIEMAKQDGDGIDPSQFSGPDSSDDAVLNMAAGLVRLVIARHTPQPERTPFDVDHAPEIATFLSKIEELKERNREQPGQPGDRAAGGEGAGTERGEGTNAEQGVEVPLPGA